MQDSSKNIIDKAKDFFGTPGGAGWFFIGIGIIICIGAIRKWSWVFESDGRVFNMRWIREMFGDVAAQILMFFAGLALILGGVYYIRRY